MSEIRVENIIGETGTDAVKFTKGINVTGVTTATSFSGSGANLTSLPAANLTGTLPAISGANLTGTGKILQIVQEYDSSFPRLQTNSTTFVASTFKVTITPTKANSKILIDFRFISNNNGNGADLYIAVRRSIAGGSFAEFTPTGSNFGSGNKHITRNYGGSSRNEISSSFQYLDSPSYTLGQAIEYKMYARSGNSSHYVEIPSSPNGTPVLCFATEVAA